MDARQYFYQQVYEGHLYHAYVLVGGSPKSQDDLFVHITQALACSQTKGIGQPDQTCTLCHRIERDEFSDMVRIEAQGQHIKVDQIRDLRDWLSKSPLEVNFKIVYIKEADQMNQAAANAILKVLEEPPAEVYFILGTKERANLMPTILSRSQTYYLTQENQERELTDQEALFNLSNLDKEHFYALPEHTQNQLLDLSSEDLAEWFDLVQQFYQGLYRKKLRVFVQIQMQFTPLMGSRRFDAAIDYLSWINYQVIRYREGQGQEKNHFIEKMTESHQQDREYLFSIQAGLLEARQYLTANVSSQLVAEKLVLSLMA